MWKFCFSYMDERVDLVYYMCTICQNACVTYESDCSATWPLTTWLELTQNNPLAAHWCIQKKDYSRETSKASSCLAETNAEGETVEENALEASMLQVCIVSVGNNTKRLLHQGRATSHDPRRRELVVLIPKTKLNRGCFWPGDLKEVKS